MCVVVFLLGLFPVSPRIDGVTTDNAAPPRLVRRVVWVVIDALRGDFGLLPLAGVRGVAYADCRAPSPTVTLPRLFALVTGSEPSFVQALSNFGGGGNVAEDSVVRQWREAGMRLVMYGDDTWLSLFPAPLWVRSEGVASFAVRDTVEVDANVTRNMRRELGRRDWDVMVLHFLGLDHVGHSLGPSHPRLAEKLAEMRAAVEEIAAGLDGEDLIVVSGDHGMTADGNHGGGTRQETSTMQLFLQPSVTGRIVAAAGECHQADVAATLAELTGIAAPRNCLGVPLTEAIEAAGGSGAGAMRRSELRLREWALAVGSVFESAAQLRRLGEVRVAQLTVGMAALAVSLVSIAGGRRLVHPAVGVCVAAMAGALLQLDQLLLWPLLLYIGAFVAVPIVSLRLSMQTVLTAMILMWNFSSSFAEESHLAFFFVLQTVCVLRGNWLAVLLLRLGRELNAGGDKWRHSVLPLCQWLSLPPSSSAVFAVLVAGGSGSIAVLPLSLLVALHAVAPGVWLARSCMAAAVAQCWFRRNKHEEVRAAVCLVLQLLHHANGPCKVAAVALCYAVCRSLHRRNWELRLAGLVFAGALGMSLSVASIPLSGAYTLVGSGYHETVVFATGLLCVAAPQIVAASFLLINDGEWPRSDLAWSACRAFACCASAFVQRGHLFVWSVWGPLVAWQTIDLGVALARAAYCVAAAS